jgi:uncharacterized protein (DUF1778 family)
MPGNRGAVRALRLVAGEPFRTNNLLRPAYCRTFPDVKESTMTARDVRSARLEARIAPEALALVRHAAELEGRSVSDFVVTAVRDAARRRIEEAHIIRLAVDDQRRFAKALLDPPPLAPAMERAREIHRRLTTAEE